MVIAAVIRLLFPSAPIWLGSLLATALPAVFELVNGLKEQRGMSGDEKRSFVICEAREILDTSFDDIPAWEALSEKRRDRILGGLAELSLWVSDVAGDVGDRKTRRLLRKSLAKLGKR